MIQPTGPVAALFQRANDGIDRRDWKLAVDSLQRIIEDGDGAVLHRPDGAMAGGVLYESARRQAMRRLRELPPEGLEAYRLLYDGAAKGLLERGHADHDEGSVRLVLDRYLLTSYGDDAVDLLTSWMLDEGRATEALGLLADLESFVPDGGVALELTLGKKAAAHVLLGQTHQAAATLNELASRSSGLPAWCSEIPSLGRIRPSATDGGTQALRPRFLSDVPWRHAIRPSRSRWVEVRDASGSAPELHPIDNVAIDGKRVFARTPTGCVALNAADLSLVWQAPAPGSDEELRALAARFLRGQDAVDAAVDRWVTDTISLAGGLVLTIERDRDPVRKVESLPAIQMGMRAPQTPGTELMATTLTAHDAESGAVRWRTGLATGDNEASRTVELRGGPISVGSHLWTYVWRQNEHTLLLLDPADGSVVREIVLYVGSRNTKSRKAAQHLAHVDDVVYVPTDGGFLFAVDARRKQVKWAAQYPSTANLAGLRWVPAPPIVRGGVVIVTPADRPDVVAFSASDGTFRWSANPPGVTYVLGGNHDSIWLAGTKLTSLSLADGSLRWALDVPGLPAGRGAVVDGFAYLPTDRSVVVVDALRGAMLEPIEVPASELPLGSLYASGVSFYAADGASIRQFPDVDRLYPLVRAKSDADPGDITSVVLLGWLETLRGEAAESQRRLSRLDSGSWSPAQRARINAAKVHALLRSAEDRTVEASESIASLREAMNLAQTSTDRLRAAAALADRLAAAGRAAEGYELLWRLGISPEGESFIARAEGVRLTSRVEVARLLWSMHSKLEMGDAASLAQLTEAAIQDLARGLRGERSAVRTSQQALLAAAEVTTIGWGRQTALLALADWEASSARLEQAEQHFLQCIHLDLEPTLTATAMMRLVELYMTPAFRVFGEANRWLQELEARFAKVPIPPVFAGLAGLDPMVGDWVLGMRQTLAATEGTQPIDPRHSGFTFPSPGARQGNVRGLERGRLVRWEGFRPPGMEDRVYIHDRDPLRRHEVLRAVDLRTEQLCWETDLILPADAPLSTTSQTQNRAIPQPTAERATGVGGANTAVFVGTDVILAVGMVTGKRLWAVRREPDLSDDAGPQAVPPTAARDGVVVARPERDRLTLLRLTDGSTIWERPLHGESVDRLWMTGHMVVAADARQERVLVYHRETGALAHRIAFRQPEGDGASLPLLVKDSVVIGPMSSRQSDSLSAVDLQTGKPVWDRSFGQSILKVFSVEPDCVGVSLRGGTVVLHDARTGEEVLHRRIPEAVVINDVILSDGLLVTMHGGSAALRSLAAVDVATGELAWQRSDLAPATRCDWPLKAAGKLIPVCVETSGRTNRGGTSSPVLALALIDLRNGETVGPQVNLPTQAGPGNLIQDWELWPEWIVLDTRDRPVAVRTKPNSDEGGS